MICADTAKKWARCCQSTLVMSMSFQVRFVHQGGGLQRVSGPLIAQVGSCNATQGAIHMGCQLLQRILISPGPGAEELRCFRSVVFGVGWDGSGHGPRLLT